MAHSALEQALAAFTATPSTEVQVERLGGGHINDTFRVADGPRTFILQRISPAVFPRPEVVAENFQIISDHIQLQNQQQTRQLVCSSVVAALDGRLYWKDDEGAVWRAQTYLDHIPPAGDLSKLTLFGFGQILARFHQMTHNLDVASLQDPLPGFHQTSRYLTSYDEAAAHLLQASEEISFCQMIVDQYRTDALCLETQVAAGSISRRIIHGDPKNENFIVSPVGEITGLLDLDTVGAGLIEHDLGDCLRSCCNTADENEHNVGKVHFDLNSCAALLAGYSDELPETENLRYVYEGVLTISYELGLRFLTDHLQGDIYFRVREHGENLRRAMVQFSLVQSIARQEQQIRELAAAK